MHPRNQYEMAAFGRDAGFVALLVLAFSLTYALGMGFHADDYNFLALFREDLNGGRSLWELAVTGPQSVRPVHVLYLGLLHHLFGADTLWLQAANTVMLAGANVLLLALLRQFGWSRLASLTTVVIYAFLPHHSTLRFWYTAFQETLALQLALASGLLFLRAVWSRPRDFWICGPLSVLALVGSGLAYEMQMPALAAIPVIALGLRRDAWRRTVALGAIHWIAMIGVFAWKVAITTRTAPLSIRPILRAVCTSFVDAGLLLPSRAYHAFTLLEPPAIALVIACGVAVFFWLRAAGTEDPPGRRAGARALACAFAMFCAGYAMTAVTGGIETGATGMRNRTAFVAAIGLAMMVYPAVSLLSARWTSVWRRSIAATAASVVLMSMIVIAAEGRLWARAWEAQQDILRGIQAARPRLEPAESLVLDASCAYAGPAKIFSEGFDLEWALRYSYGHLAIRADVTHSDMEIRPGGLLFRGVHSRFFQWQHLTIYNAVTRRATRVANRQQAVDYFAHRPQPQCADWIPGLGASTFGCAPCDQAAAAIRQKTRGASSRR